LEYLPFNVWWKLTCELAERFDAIPRLEISIALMEVW